MQLDEYMLYKGLKVKDIAEKLDIGANYAAMLKRGIVKPSKKLARKIESVTEGCVSFLEAMRPINRRQKKEILQTVSNGWDSNSQ